jgi:hypothetical protein
MTRLAVTGLLAALLAAGCRKDPLKHMTDEESRIYISNYDTAAVFSDYRTFSIDDSVNVIENNELAGRELDSFAVNVISSIRQLMQARGYTEVDKDAGPDLAVNASKVINTQTGIFSYPDYWGSYGFFYDPYYWGYPGYDYYAPFVVGVYTIREGGLEIDLLDLKHATAEGDKITIVWSGLARGEGVFDPGNAATEIRALFDQSAYLQTSQSSQ